MVAGRRGGGKETAAGYRHLSRCAAPSPGATCVSSCNAPFLHTAKRYAETHDPSIIWEGHKAGRHIGYLVIMALSQKGGSEAPAEEVAAATMSRATWRMPPLDHLPPAKLTPSTLV